MVLKYLNWIVLLGIIQCWWFTTRAAQIDITVNGSSSNKTLRLNDTLAVTCTVTSNSTVSSFSVRRTYGNFEYFGNTNTGTMNKTVTCDDNNYFRCYARLDGASVYSTSITVTVECPPYWSETVQEPVVIYSRNGENDYVNIKVRGQPQPTYIVQKYTSTGLQDLPITVDLKTYTGYFRLYFRAYSEESHGVYQMKANNSLGTLTTNVTLRGPTLPAKNVRAWSTTPNTIHVEWTAGELFDTSTYYIHYKSKTTNWKYKFIRSTNSTLTYIFKSFQPNTTYYFLVRSYYSKYGYSVYSNLIQATTLRDDIPQATPNSATESEAATRIDITVNGSSSRKTTLKLNDTLTVTCAVTSNSTPTSLYVDRNSISIKNLGSSNTGTMNKTATCDDNTNFECYASVDGSSMYSASITVTVECPPTWSETVQQPVIVSSRNGEDDYVNIYVCGQPQPTYIVQKYTSTGLQDLPITVDIQTTYTGYFSLYFRNYSEESHGVYQIKAYNSVGAFTTNVTLRGPTLPAKNVRAWSTSRNTIHVEWTAGELFDSSTYYIYYKLKGTHWKYKYIRSINSTLTYIFKSFQPNTTYYFFVRAGGKYDISDYSNLAQATTLSLTYDNNKRKG